MSSDHYFNVKIAKDYGIEEATFLNNMAFWTKTKLANNQSIKGGFCWIYHTLEAWTDFFPYWSAKNIDYILNKLVKQGLLVKAKLSPKKSDRTGFYAMTPKAFKYYEELAVDKYIQRLDKSRDDDKLVTDNDGKLLISLISQKWEMDFPKMGNVLIQIINQIKSQIIKKALANTSLKSQKPKSLQPEPERP